MNTTLTHLASFAAALAVVVTVAASTPALAKDRVQAGHAARAQAIEQVITQDGVSRDRAQALRDCNGQVASLKEYTWGGNAPSQIYRACMAQHGQQE